MSTTPTIEDFLSQEQPDEYDEPCFPEPAILLPSEAIGSIAASLRELVQIAGGPAETVTELREQLSEERARYAELDQSWHDLRQSYTEVGQRLGVEQGRVASVLEICKPSTSKLAKAIRAELDPQPALPTENSDPAAGGENAEVCPVHGWEHKFKTCDEVTAALADDLSAPGPDAAVEVTAALADDLSAPGPDVDKANRSQIRTMLGIEQPVSGDGR